MPLKIFWFLVLLVALLICAVARGEAPDQAARWNEAKLDPKEFFRLEQLLARFKRNEAIYRKLESSEVNGVPAAVIFALHYRESDNSFSSHLHEGSTLLHRTRDVPKGRLPAPAEPPFTFAESAVDALYTYEHLERRDWTHLPLALQAIESYNGLGYQRMGRISPYMWSGTSLYKGGKYVADGRFSASARDAQLGVMAILRHFKTRGVSAAFEPP